MRASATAAAVALLLLAATARAELDVPAMLYKGRETGKSTPLALLPDPLPASLVERLKNTGAEKAPVFAELSPPLQRALLWDVGLVLAADGSRYVQVKTKCGKTMSDIFLSKDTVRHVANCPIAVCNAQILEFAYPNCSADAIAAETRCAVSSSDPALASAGVLRNSTFWSAEGNVEDSFNFRVFKHDASVSATVTRSELYTIYQSPGFQLRDENTCPNKATVFVVPCQVLAENRSSTPDSWCTPYSGYIVDLWVAEEVNAALHAADHSSWVQTATIFIALFGLACLVSASFGFIMWRTRARKAAPTPTHYAVLHNHRGNTFVGALTPRPTATGASSGEHASHSSQLLAIDRLNDEYLAKSRELADFVDDEELLVRKIDYDALQFDRLIAKGANGEVWCGEYAGQFNTELLPLIRNGRIAPQFRPDCPPAVLTLAHACLNQDPEKRPNAMQIVYLLQSKS
ncbi:hypothetical protein PybrP1_002709 [[Pythium] brassicae (nom. inval.)]|nr:hypothetical protein PybrP1_002709 [[Pythium] brassicae (nom. inval.)]